MFPAALLDQNVISPPSLFARNPNIYGVNCALKLRFGSWQFHFLKQSLGTCLLCFAAVWFLLVAAVSCSSSGTLGMSHAHGRIPMSWIWHFSIFFLLLLLRIFQPCPSSSGVLCVPQHTPVRFHLSSAPGAFGSVDLLRNEL